MALANDAIIRDGACIGDPTEGALVVLAAKGGLDVAETRRLYPRVGEVPFDAEYKLMATFHEMDDDGRPVIRCLVKGAPDVLLARSSTYLDADGRGSGSIDRRSGPRAGRERPPRQRGHARAGRARAGTSIRRRSTRTATLLDLVEDLQLLALIGIVDPPRKEAQRRDRAVPRRRDPGADDHRRPRDHRGGDRRPARHHRSGDHRRRVRGDARRRADPPRSTRSASSPASPPRTRSASSASSRARGTSSR